MSTLDEAIEISVGDHLIAGTLVRPATMAPGFLFIHGWGGQQEQYLARAREIAALGAVCLTLDLRGHGRTRHWQDTVTREENLRDVVAGYDRLAGQRGIPALFHCLPLRNATDIGMFDDCKCECPGFGKLSYQLNGGINVNQVIIGKLLTV